MPERRHQCPGECGSTVGYAMFACRDCWRRLPGELRALVLRGYRHRASDPAAHRRAMIEATNWLRSHPVSAHG